MPSLIDGVTLSKAAQYDHPEIVKMLLTRSKELETAAIIAAEEEAADSEDGNDNGSEDGGGVSLRRDLADPRPAPGA